ncbi:MAG TPA: META domain-containing protein [Sphingomicrobium sp.]|nr:META domain-containing protein [Sphingomicrobium sp.]
MAAAGFKALALALACSACTSMAADQRTFEGTGWNVTAINGQPTTGSGDFIVRFDNGQIGGRLGCNHFGGPYRVSGDIMTVGSVAATQMACEPALDTPHISPMQFESWSFAILGSPMRIGWKGDGRLTLSNAAGSIDLLRAR